MRRAQADLQHLLIVVGSIPSSRRIGSRKLDDEDPFRHWIAFQQIDPAAAASDDAPTKTGNCCRRFDPKSEKFDSFPLPDPYASVRQLAGRPGEVWGAESGADKLFVLKPQ